MSDKNKDMLSQIDEMINPVIESEGTATEHPVTEPPAEITTEAPPTSPPGTEAPGTNAPATEAPATEAPATDAPTTEAPAERSREELLTEDNERLRKELEEAKTKEDRTTKTPTTTAPLELDEIDFVDKYKIDPDDLKTFNAALNAVYKEAVVKGKALAIEETYRGIPEIVKHNIVVHTALKGMTDKFYLDNKDLIPHKGTISTIAEEIIGGNPTWTLEQVFDETEKVTRERLKLKKQIIQDDKDKDPNPKFPKTPGARKTKPKPKVKDGMLGQIDAMNESL